MGGRSMRRVFQKINLLEWVGLALTLVFVLGTLLWFRISQPEAGVTMVTVEDTGREISAPEKPDAPGILEGELLNLNTASPEDLTRLPGIGEKKAAAIVAWREENGPFRTVDDVISVSGIGEKILSDIRPYVTV